MSPSTLAIALLIAVVVWGLIVRNLTAKPWTSPANADPRLRDIGPIDQPAARVGFYLLLGVISSFFLLFIAAYMMRMDSHHGGGNWHSVHVPTVLWINTLLLILASGAMQWARSAGGRMNQKSLLTALLAGGLLTLAFLFGQVMAWQQLGPLDHLRHNAAGAFFVLLTGLHGLHLIGGLVVWGRSLIRLGNSNRSVRDIQLSVELCSVYWHYLLIVWLVLFILLLTT